MEILIGLLIGVVGITLLVNGLRVFFFMLPIVGFVTGFFLGATLITNWLGDGFLSTAAGWIVGILIGLAFGFVSYLWWYAGALMAAGASGALLSSALFSAFGVDNGTVLFIIALVGAALFVFVSVVLNLPVYVVLVNTAILGANMLIGAFLLVFDRVDLEAFDWGVGRAAARDNWFWWLVLVVLVAAGIFSQMRLIHRIRLPRDRWVRADSY